MHKTKIKLNSDQYDGMLERLQNYKITSNYSESDSSSSNSTDRLPLIGSRLSRSRQLANFA